MTDPRPNPAPEIDRETCVRYCCVVGFISCLLISATTASKVYLLNLGFFELIIPVGTSLYAITFLCTDVISETAGRRHAFVVVLAGFFARIFALIFLYFAVNVPGAEGLWNYQNEYALILLGTGGEGAGRILAAGIITLPNQPEPGYRALPYPSQTASRQKHAVVSKYGLDLHLPVRRQLLFYLSRLLWKRRIHLQDAGYNDSRPDRREMDCGLIGHPFGILRKKHREGPPSPRFPGLRSCRFLSG